MHKFIKFIQEDIWLEPNNPRKPIRSFFLRWLCIFYRAGIGFERDQCSLKASALTFYTLLSMVPVLAVAFGIAKGFGFENHLQKQIMVQFKENPEVGEMATAFAYSFLERAQGGLIAGIGILFLLWSVFKLLNNIENALNTIWKVSHPRTILRMLSDYLAIMFICPIFIVISSSLTIYISAELRYIVHNTSIGEVITPAAYLIFRLIPIVLSWLVMTMIYIIMPNTRVPLVPGIIAGIIAGTAYQMIQWTYIYFQIGVSNYGAIYGSFAALPLFMLWVQLSWMIVLAGAEIAYQIENEKNCGSSRGSRKMVSIRALGLLLVNRCAKAINEGRGALPVNELAQEFGVSKDEIKQIALQLAAAGILTKTYNHIDNEYFILTRDAHTIRVADVCRSLDEAFNRKVSIIGSDALLSVEKTLQLWDTAADNAAHNLSIFEVIT